MTESHDIGDMDDVTTIARVRKKDSGVRTTPVITLARLPQHVIARAAHRVGTSALTWAGAYAVALAINEYLAHTVGMLPAHGWNIGHTAGALFVAMSLALFAVSRSHALPAERLLDLGLAYEVTGGFLIVMGTIPGMVWAPGAHIMGLPWVCVWIAGFPFVMPATPKKAGAAAFLTALMTPAGLATWVVYAGAPMPEFRIWTGITIPALLCAAVATIGSRIVYGMGRAIERAEAMGAYRLEERLSQGGMGEIWRARHHMLARPAAVKLVRLDAFQGEAARQSAIVRFEREAQMTASLSSLNTVRLYDFGVTDSGTFYYAMELLDGMDLESLVRLEGPMRPERAVHFLIQACRSLSEAHGRGLVHRDIKPANLFVCRQGEDYDVLKVLDFGLVRPDRVTSKATLLTAEASIVGTPAYMAPETATGGDIGPAADVYALGCVGYWLLSGRTVFDGRTSIEVLMHHVHDPPPPLRSRAAFPVPEPLDLAIAACLAKDPAQRPSSAAFQQRLAAVTFAQPWTDARAREAWADLRGVSEGGRAV